ncbi:MAG: ribose-phosphate diphosphokinase [Gammaproteobacteria bacterium]|nr:ribose-phosphate diphosphokinase [Gammaproteobacteria bacterium]
MMILCFDDYETQSRKLAAALDIPCHTIQHHRFPDGESKLTLPAKLPEHVLFCRSLDHPNEKLLELLLAAKTAGELGAKKLTLVAPYLCYMRQDKAFHPGEVISQPIVGNFLAELFDNVITVDPHLHRIQHLEQAVPTKNAVALTATSLMAEFLHESFKNPVLLAPDSEAEQWVSAVAKPDQWEYGVCNKIRTGDQEVEISLPEINLQGRSVIIVDDVASSGQTLSVAVKKCLLKDAKYVDVLVTHALFVNDAKARLIKAGVRNIWSTDSVSHESNIIPLYGLLKDAVLNLGKL